jgi:two-component sensor histidine kinase
LNILSRVRWPVALATLFIVLLGWYLLYTARIVGALRTDAQTFAEIYNEVAEGLSTPPGDPFGETEALVRLQEIILEAGVPMVLTVPRQGEPGADSVVAVVNLPFSVDLDTPEGQERVLRYAARLDARNPPVGDVSVQHLHYGETPEVRRLRWIPWLQVLGLLLTVAVGFTVIRYERRVDNERAWTAMARELAHQLGTPISSLQGWLEVLRLPPDDRPGELGEWEIAGSIEEDLLRLERISHRFELIGREPELKEVSVRKVIRDLERYLRSRLPRFGAGVELELDIPAHLPPIKGNETLLAWALENVVKNALDALAGRGGRIIIQATKRDPEWLILRIHDTGPGVDPEIRERIFEPGVTTKSGGWGVGLALSRRIVEGVHGGRIELLDGRDGGATFQVRLPSA